jgi:hypothetical protein
VPKKNGAASARRRHRLQKEELRDLSASRAELWLGAAGGGGAVTLSKLVHATSGVHEAGLASEERVAGRADADFEVFNRGERVEDGPASAGDGGLEGGGVEIIFHGNEDHGEPVR